MFPHTFYWHRCHTPTRQRGTIDSARTDFARAAIRAATGLAVMACAMIFGRQAFAQPPSDIDSTMWVTNGEVRAIVYSGGTIYLGGSFSQVGPPTGGAVPLSTTSDALPVSFPKVVGTVNVIAPDGSGGWYIGGSFVAVGGLPRLNLAHVAANLSVSAWTPVVGTGDPDNGVVHALALNDTTVFVGGSFASVGGQPRNNIAAIRRSDGAVRSGWDPNANDVVRALAVRGAELYAGGDFTKIQTTTRNHIADILVNSGDPNLGWDGNAGNTVYALAVNGSTVYAGGYFSAIGPNGTNRNYPRLAALNTIDGAALSWRPAPNNIVRAVVVRGDTVYAGGDFDRAGNPSGLCYGVASLDATSASLLPSWSPDVLGPVNALAVSGSTVYAGGLFGLAGSQRRNNIAALDATTGLVTSWNPNAGGAVNALAANGSTVYAGGEFTTMGGVSRSNIAAINAASGQARAWQPQADGPVNALAVRVSVNGDTVYAGGTFTHIGGQPRSRIAALRGADVDTLYATAWDPSAGPNLVTTSVDALAVSGSVVYAGGHFTNIGHAPRSYAAALNAAGDATAWTPNANGDVKALAVSATGDTVYAGGAFVSIGSQSRSRIAALNNTDGLAIDPWNGNSNGQVNAIVVGGADSIYVGGSFSSIGGQPLRGIAKLDPGGNARPTWRADAIGGVNALALDQDFVCAGGDFTSVDGMSLSRLAGINWLTGEATDRWNPTPNSPILAMAVNGSTIYVGGRFTRIKGRHGDLPQSYFAVMPDVITPTLLAEGTASAWSDRVEVTWFSPVHDVPVAIVYRRSPDEEWDEIGEVWADGTGKLAYRDAQVVAGRRYGYRLGVMDGGQETFLGETWIDVPSNAKLALVGLRSNPTSDDFRVAFSLADASPARLELFDVSGRKITARDVGNFGAGSHVVALGESRSLPAGVYMLRLSQGGRFLTTRAVMLR